MSTTIFSNDYDYILSIQSKEPLLELLSTVNYPTYTSTEADIVVSSVSFFQLRGPEGHSIESAHSALLELGLRVGDDNLSHTDIRLYKALAHSTFKGAEYLSTNPSFLVSVALSPTLEAETDFNAWYEEEHISLLSKVPGWQAWPPPFSSFSLIAHRIFRASEERLPVDKAFIPRQSRSS
ncbi:alpha beta-hydrolase [Lentinula edodes]|uniref:Alpha beta-hydrolase n=1 Tax=Lentinula edodes TaxID=5353 RepID=A0A1Q3DW88_LENED|nr:alpha beta-hydrolase [Lentinula edodes]